jgi:hypothetical protein
MIPTRAEAMIHFNNAGKNNNFIVGYIDGIDGESSQEKKNDDRYKEYAEGYSLGRNTLDISKIDDHLYNIFDGDGLNPTYITDGLWYYPDGTSRDDKDD